jgi:hypothetical protein
MRVTEREAASMYARACRGAPTERAGPAKDHVASMQRPKGCCRPASAGLIHKQADEKPRKAR